MPSQTDRLYNLLRDCKPHRTDEILLKVYGGSHLGIARCGARIHDCKRIYKCEIKGWKDANPTLYWYQIIKPMEQEQQKEMVFDFDEIRRRLFTEHFWDADYYDLVKRMHKKSLTDVDKKWIVDKFNELRS